MIPRVKGAANARADERDGDGPKRLGHVPGLDGVRGVAVLMVMFTHGMFVFVPSKVLKILAGGFLGVEIFFVLSGFLITSLLISERSRSGRISFRGFYRRRALRLLPALVVLLVVHFVYAAFDHLDLGLELRSSGESLFYVSNWYLAAGRGFTAGMQHLWSLSVEEQFYAVWPIVAAGMLAWRPTRTFAIAIIVAAIGVQTARTALAWDPGTSFLGINVINTRTDTQAVTLLAGAAAAFTWARYRIPPRVLNVLASISATFIAVCAWRWDVTAGFYYWGGYTLIGITTAIVLVAIVDGSWLPGKVFAWPPLRAVGRVSYGLYLWHLPVFFEVHRHAAGFPTSAQLAISLALTITITVSSWFFVEQTFLRRKAAVPHGAREHRRRRRPQLPRIT